MTVTVNLPEYTRKLDDKTFIAMVTSGVLPYPDFVFLFDTTGYAAQPFTKGGT